MSSDLFSSPWHWFVVIVVLANIFACWWLLRWSSKTTVHSDDGTTGHVWDEDLQEYNNPLPRWWLILFHVSIVVGLGYLVLYPGLGNFAGKLGWTQVGEMEASLQKHSVKAQELQAFWNKMSPEELSTNSTAMQTGGRLFSHYCAMCHGSDAKGTKGYPDLTDNVWLWGEDINSIEATIRHGRIAAMPAWGTQLNESEITAVASYTQHLSGKSVDEALVNQGKEQYQKNCLACHGSEGKGMQALGAPDLTNDNWLYGSDLKSLEHTIKNGRTGVMPPQESLMSDYEIKLLTAYIYSFQQKNSAK